MHPDQSVYYFRSEYERELEAWLRRRFLHLCVAYIIFAGLIVAVGVVYSILWLSAGMLGTPPWGLGAQIISLLVAVWFWRNLRNRPASRSEILQAATRMILILGGLSLIGILFRSFTLSTGTEGMLALLFYWHLFACVFLPWTPKESLKPIVPLMIVWAIGTMILRPDGWVLSFIGSPVIVMPGLAICALRLHWHGRKFHMRMLGRHFLTMREEFDRARSIHESMFPAPFTDRHLRFDYAFTPMKELGGDFVHLHRAENGLTHLTIIDVTGHGLAAALTVNRVYGELERIRAESPGAGPGEVISLLNRYFHLTLAKHGIYATAACFTIDAQQSRMDWASAGHPPGFLRGANRGVTALGATAVLLGALPDHEFTHDERSIELSPGDVLVVCTDGAFEGRNREGEQLGLERLHETMTTQPPPRNWPQFLSSIVERHTHGSREDDLLIASIQFIAPMAQDTEDSTLVESGIKR
ncbi:MAG TPA: PP2C family protein-serine/threonine phosphatase [Phycisphaerales bacterium]|nr:PP2C family protein-serine/threonine phosphatase [Phycisphaerales bacterium]HRQ74660.1 PP2C family protein-serine/threonine phosphatase [Phycisphaerales bacterium]